MDAAELSPVDPLTPKQQETIACAPQRDFTPVVDEENRAG
ncbi:hypothetical protein SFHH103_02510 [Sinorhizobium fredii HH103]|uniref:Uncharacterized protein n=1 Tax=Sinorhizobium fredii (strain HH103) TaxID=1117943 RepID=G9AAA1_SINF1|nr:hypothetical protein SFHH103_02510 [Sinorhizobium fredii HH103]